ncbi:TRAP transporter small permease [Sporosarcina obsidiansis]|uniref:TRAP transporter small permease n=1 Tax=Sporosarcina obsidiansis TaxID=2660748 RepID=UPI00129BCB00|nr:TRAP transporter small permease [Sporosarcina obsidiansis]
MNVIKKLSDTVYKFESFLAIILMTVMLISITAGVTFRYFFNSPLSWPEELAIITLVWVTFVGGSMSIKRQQAAAVSLLLDRLSDTLRKILLAIGFMLIIIFSVYVFYQAFQWISVPSVFLQKLPALGIAMFYPYLAIPLGFAGMVIHTLSLFLDLFTTKKDPLEA